MPEQQAAVVVHTEEGSVVINGTTYAGRVDACLELAPRPCVRFHGHFKNIPTHRAIGLCLGPAEAESFVVGARSIPGFLCGTSGSVGDDEELILHWCPSSEPVPGIGDENAALQRVTAHVFNLPQILGVKRSSQNEGTTTYAIEHVLMEFDGWVAELKSLPSTSQAIKAIKEKGGHSLTHVIGVEKADGELFSGKQAEHFVTALQFFLSFAFGAWYRPVCPVGTGESGVVTWSLFSSPQDLRGHRSSWLDTHTATQLAELFPLFMEKWGNEAWHQAFHEVIYWYMIANSSSNGVDAGLILAQTAIERLAFEFAVNERRLLSGTGFRDLKASDRFRLLFSSLQIPLDIPPELHEIAARSKKNHWLDAPHALTEIRNSLVHPEHKSKGTFSDLFYDTWNLSLWYLEMSVLAICGYSGTYGSRLKRRRIAEVEPVPWAANGRKCCNTDETNRATLARPQD